jgi:hypothetical protein
VTYEGALECRLAWVIGPDFGVCRERDMRWACTGLFRRKWWESLATCLRRRDRVGDRQGRPTVSDSEVLAFVSVDIHEGELEIPNSETGCGSYNVSWDIERTELLHGVNEDIRNPMSHSSQSCSSDTNDIRSRGRHRGPLHCQRLIV